MVYRAKDLLARLTYLTLLGQEEEAEETELDWAGTKEQWDMIIRIENDEE